MTPEQLKKVMGVLLKETDRCLKNSELLERRGKKDEAIVDLAVAVALKKVAAALLYAMD